MFSMIRNLSKLSSVVPKIPKIQIIPANMYHLLGKQLPLTPVITMNVLPLVKFLSPFLPSITQSCGMKVKGRLRRRCKDCYFVMRQERLYVMCKTHPRHKQMAMKKKEKNTWILTHATQSPLRPY